MSNENEQIVRQAFEAFNSEDIERILALTHADFEAVVPPELSAEPDTYRGHDGIRRYFASFQYAMAEIRFQPERFWEVGQSVAVAATVRAKGRQTGIPVEQQLAQVWTIHDEQVIGVRTYASLVEALNAVGLEM